MQPEFNIYTKRVFFSFSAHMYVRLYVCEQQTEQILFQVHRCAFAFSRNSIAFVFHSTQLTECRTNENCFLLIFFCLNAKPGPVKVERSQGSNGLYSGSPPTS